MERMPLFAGLDVHGETTTGTIKDEKGNPVRALKVETCPDGMKKLFERLKKSQITAVFEATRNWPYYASLLRPHCREVIMAHPLKVKAIASARIKTDDIDSETLCDLLRANLIPQSFMPPPDIVELREVLRYRAGLSKMRAKLKVKCKMILSREGKTCEFKDITSKRARLWITHLQLGSLNRRELDYTLSLVDNLSEEMNEFDKMIEKKQYEYPEVDILKSIPGISTYSGLLILAEIAGIERFPTPHKLTAYAGLVPSTYQSSNTQYHGRITKRGDAWLRWILGQCTHACLKTQKSHRLKRTYLRIQRKKGTQKALVATSRKMLVIIWNLLNKNEYFAG